MKKKFSLFVLLPALMLSSCGNGAEVTDSAQLKELTQGISAKVKDIKAYEMTSKSTGATYDETEKKNIAQSSEMIYRQNANGEKYLKSSSQVGEEKDETTIYLVKNEKYQQVLYVDSYDAEAKKNEVTVYGYEGNELTFSFAALYFISPEIYTELFLDPAGLDVAKAIDAAGDEEDDMNVSAKYYSKGAGNLTVEISGTVKSEVKADAEETAVKETLSATYDNYYWKSAVIEFESNKGNKNKTDITFTVKDEVKIELPSGWESLINKEAA